MDFTQEVLAVTGGVIVGSFLLRCLIKKCKRDCYDVHTPTPANTPLPPQEEQQSHPQPTAPTSYTYYPQNNPYNSYSSYPQENRFVVYIPPVSQTARYV
jgi:hypothetical protein